MHTLHKLKMYRNLTAGEIYDQVFSINQYAIKKFKKPITNIVFMGMGEPLLNVKNVCRIYLKCQKCMRGHDFVPRGAWHELVASSLPAGAPNRG